LIATADASDLGVRVLWKELLHFKIEGAEQGTIVICASVYKCDSKKKHLY